MARYRNGRIPASQLVWFWALNQYGKRERFRATRATAARLTAFIDDVKTNEGVQLYITSGPNVYRDYGQQVGMRAKYAALGKPLQAAYPGTSSHGGEYRGRDSLAADIYNYDAIPWATFVKYAKKHGLITNFVTPTEYWHIGDPNPFSMPSTGGTGLKLSSRAEKQIASIFDAIFVGGTSMDDDGRSISQSLAEIRTLTSKPIQRDGKDIPVRQDNADTGTIVREIRTLTTTPIKRGDKEVPVRQDNADTGTLVREVLATVKAQKAAIEALAVAKGADPDAIAKAVEDGVKQAMKDVSFTVETD
ncbi:hypothetical protein [Paramicrobacterium agarici]|uniref:hypothetical protein n=1 Tax=Paramicrobacterium agarici TaxID=630514 RepID=UPI001151D6E3|nr:hypothetical protein [Microbacterium agarici]TQO23776.1 hypothetical protein FB385_2637 [Microbacterium agarici]